MMKTFIHNDSRAVLSLLFCRAWITRCQMPQLIYIKSLFLLSYYTYLYVYILLLCTLILLAFSSSMIVVVFWYILAKVYH